MRSVMGRLRKGHTAGDPGLSGAPPPGARTHITLAASALCLALLVPLFVPDPAIGLAGALRVVASTEAALEPAQYHKHPSEGQKTKPKAPQGSRHGHAGPPTKSPLKTAGPPGFHLLPPRQIMDPRYPHFPPLLVPPDLTAEQAKILQSLPRRMDKPPQGAPPPTKVAREILVLVDQSQPQSLEAELAQAHSLELVSSRRIALLDARAVLLRVRPGGADAAALAALQNDARVRLAQFNLLYYHSGGEKRDGPVIPQYGPLKVRLPEAHKLALGRSVVVAVIDSQVDLAHPDLTGAVVRPFDAVGDADTAPDFHGTAVAGILGSHGVVEAVAPQAVMLAVRAFRTKAGGPPETTSEILLGAIDWAAGNGARVINMSFVGPPGKSLEDALAAASRKGLVLVAAAGNAGPKAPPAYPAAYSGVIAVTAVDAADRRYLHANRGHYIAVAAPGVDVLVPVDGGKYALLTGTSYAAAYVSGIAALLLERDPSLDAAAVARLIAAGADDLGPAGRDEDFGAGRINALATLKSLDALEAR